MVIKKYKVGVAISGSAMTPPQDPDKPFTCAGPSKLSPRQLRYMLSLLKGKGTELLAQHESLRGFRGKGREATAAPGIVLQQE